ncbi:uncharacterized protein [Pyrus communis]|uniref:uncharacterized protein n=1 Tax=Pyrus communis TaxID=23211 RepID=UPI0035C02474
MPPSIRGRGMMIETTDYFTKWVKAKPITTTTQMDIEHFIWKNYRFGIPHFIVIDNGSQFVGKDLARFFKKYGFKQHMSTPRYPQGNGQAKYGSEAIIPPNVVVPSINTVLPNFEQNEKEMSTNFDLAEE